VTLTSAEAAEVLGVSTSGLRTLVERGRITPLAAGARPLTFHATDVFDLQVQRRTKADVAWHEALWAAVDQVVAGQLTA
jgi:excisionase family DNA binding protein